MFVKSGNSNDSMKQVFDELLGQSLQDIVICGVVDLDCDPAEFVPLMEQVYLEVGGKLIQLRRDVCTLEINVALVDAIQLDCQIEDTQRLCYSSTDKYTLTDRLADNRISRIEIYAGEGERIVAIEINLVSGQLLFFEPSFVDGINFGGVEQKACWLANCGDHRVIVCDSSAK